ncbi:hypothetical protein Pan241w_00460 [Gimesia alba]|uniref:Uncharacterized protein n=1 Tax=Gimesia alba TaxID=2527973 RepID=A0A517R874_9PLAN|nr:hypothetical protein Pan241w_00460 [Gimesia alba]
MCVVGVGLCADPPGERPFVNTVQTEHVKLFARLTQKQPEPSIRTHE